MDKIKSWIVEHDESNIFVILYITLAVVLSIAISLFWLVIVVLIHFIFELIKQAELNSGIKGIILRSSWELLLDFGLILFAFVISIYMDIILGAAGIGAGARAGMQSASKVGARFAGWQRVLRGFLLSVDDLAQLSKFSKKDQNQIDETENAEYGGWEQNWSFGDKSVVIFTVLCFALILFAPYLTGYNFENVFQIIMEDLHPLP